MDNITRPMIQHTNTTVIRKAERTQSQALPDSAEPPASLTGIVLDAIRDPHVNLDRLQALLRCAVLASMMEVAR